MEAQEGMALTATDIPVKAQAAAVVVDKTRAQAEQVVMVEHPAAAVVVVVVGIQPAAPAAPADAAKYASGCGSNGNQSHGHRVGDTKRKRLRVQRRKALPIPRMARVPSHSILQDRER